MFISADQQLSRPDTSMPGGDSVGEASQCVRQMMQAAASRREILTRLATVAEAAAGADAVVSILVLDQDGLLRNGASPNLPSDYLTAIDRLKPDARVGTCAAAAATGSVVLTPDFRADDKWAELRHLPLALGFAGAWSMPIKGPDGKVLGTFGTYYRAGRSPSPDEVQRVEQLAAAAALVLAESGPTNRDPA
jgi:GAF domain-containing protein